MVVSDHLLDFRARVVADRAHAAGSNGQEREAVRLAFMSTGWPNGQIGGYQVEITEWFQVETFN